jgi:hypothetical protein
MRPGAPRIFLASPSRLASSSRGKPVVARGKGGFGRPAWSLDPQRLLNRNTVAEVKGGWLVRQALAQEYRLE